MKWNTPRIRNIPGLEDSALTSFSLLVALLINKPEDISTVRRLVQMEAQYGRVRLYGLLKNVVHGVGKIQPLLFQAKHGATKNNHE